MPVPFPSLPLCFNFNHQQQRYTETMSTGILRTDNERIFDANGDAVLLRGVSPLL